MPRYNSDSDEDRKKKGKNKNDSDSDDDHRRKHKGRKNNSDNDDSDDAKRNKKADGRRDYEHELSAGISKVSVGAGQGYGQTSQQQPVGYGGPQTQGYNSGGGAESYAQNRQYNAPPAGYGQQVDPGRNYQSPPSGYGSQGYTGNSMQQQQPGYVGGTQAPLSRNGSTLAPALNFVGPFLRFHDIDTERRAWTGSVLIITRTRPDRPPVCAYSDGTSPAKNAPIRELATYEGNVFYRFDLVVPLTNGGDKAIAYTINNGTPYTFYVPPLGADCRVMGMSCNGFSSDVTNPDEAGGITPLWKDVLRRHHEKPFHVMLGGGDQLYMDPIFTSNDAILAWLKIDGRDAKSQAPFTQELKASVEKFCFNNYVKSFGQDVMKDAFATIPYIFQWDDHDIFDGWGSYPSWLADSPVFKGIYAAARDFYLLFQQHTADMYRQQDSSFVFGANGSFSFLKHLGPTVAVLGVDTRSERSLTQIASPESWNTVFDNLYKRTRPGVKHLIVMLAIPVVWPRLTAADSAMEGLSGFLEFASTKLSAFSMIPVPQPIAGIGEAIGKTGLYKSIMGCFGEPELADDLCDHWTHKNHEAERLSMMTQLQSFAQQRGIRVTFLSGDVHCTGVGWFRSKEQQADVTRDHRVMWQIVSSAIVNIPPPGMVINMLHRKAGPYDLDNNTVDELLSTFSEDVDGKSLDTSSNKVLGRRNWCSVEVDGRDLAWNIYVERVDRQADAKAYPVRVAGLVL
ncbi:hypothetical protein SpCBS45565_g02960 [Spizellomyces sp. 'palustris']|nr:hypothetical protein SpCBS45565_g02960 [Spizellomyces sp. 'palustris']